MEPWLVTTMSRLFASMRPELSMNCAAFRALVARGAVPDEARGAPIASGADSVTISAAAPSHLKERIRWALLSLGTLIVRSSIWRRTAPSAGIHGATDPTRPGG